MDWLLRLAFEELRIVTAMLARGDVTEACRAPRIDIVLSGAGATTGASGITDHDGVAQAVLESGEEDREPAPERRPDDPVRIVVTS